MPMEAEHFEDYSVEFIVIDKEKSLAETRAALQKSTASKSDGYLVVVLEAGKTYGIARLADMVKTINSEPESTRLARFDFHPATTASESANVETIRNALLLRPGLAYVILNAQSQVIALLVNDELELPYRTIESTGTDLRDRFENARRESFSQVPRFTLRGIEAQDQPALSSEAIRNPIRNPVRSSERPEGKDSYLNLAFTDITYPDEKHTLRLHEGFECGHTYLLKVSIGLKQDARFSGETQPEIERPPTSVNTKVQGIFW